MLEGFYIHGAGNLKRGFKVIRFLAELNQGYYDIQPTPSNEFSKDFNISYLDLSDPPNSSYWLDWGGHYDNLTGSQISVYFEQYLTRVKTLNDILVRPIDFPLHPPHLIFIQGRTALINIPRHPWLYPDYSQTAENVLPFLSSALNPDNPSNNIIRDAMAPVKLGIPNFTTKISDNINGITLNQGFSLSLNNNDGYFDDAEKWNLFNKPLHLKKSIVENPQYEDFQLIRNGLIENTTTTFDNVRIEVADNFRGLTEPVCDIIREGDVFGDFQVTGTDVIGRNIPIVYGDREIPLLRIMTTENNHIFLMAEQVRTLWSVFDRNRNRIPDNFISRQNNVVIITINDDYRAAGLSTPTSALIRGHGNSATMNLADIIMDVIIRKTNIKFNNSHFNINEINRYRQLNINVSAIIDRGTVRDAIQNILKSDMVYFIQQNDGRFTLRRYGMEYATHKVTSNMITQKPERTNNRAQENYFSSCIINFINLSPITGESIGSFIFGDNADEAERLYKRRVIKTFYTNLMSGGINSPSPGGLAALLSNRFTFIKNTIRVAVGIDTSGFELIDTVEIDFNINDRQFNESKRYFIKELNPAQDILILEEL